LYLNILSSKNKKNKEEIKITCKENVYIFCADCHNNLIMILNYWDEGDYGDFMPELSGILPVAKKIKSRFFTLDTGIKEDGSLVIIETGDGHVAGLPENADVMYFYKKMSELMG